MSNTCSSFTAHLCSGTLQWTAPSPKNPCHSTRSTMVAKDIMLVAHWQVRIDRGTGKVQSPAQEKAERLRVQSCRRGRWWRFEWCRRQRAVLRPDESSGTVSEGWLIMHERAQKTERRKKIVAEEGKKERIFGLPPFRASTLRAQFLWSQNSTSKNWPNSKLAEVELVVAFLSSHSISSMFHRTLLGPPFSSSFSTSFSTIALGCLPLPRCYTRR